MGEGVGKWKTCASAKWMTSNRRNLLPIELGSLKILSEKLFPFCNVKNDFVCFGQVCEMQKMSRPDKFLFSRIFFNFSICEVKSRKINLFNNVFFSQI